MLKVLEPIESLFLAAGWKPVQEAAQKQEAHASAHLRAHEIARQFGGLRVGQAGPGTEQAASDVHFYSAPRPEVSAVISPWEADVGACAAFATAHNDHMILFVNHAGEYFAFTDPDDCLYKLEGTFSEAMQKLLFGYRFGAPLTRCC